MPDGFRAGVTETIEKRSVCLPVAVDSFGHGNRAVAGSIVWNHRWEHDKGIDLLLDIVTGLIAEGVECQFNLSGQQFSQIPDEMTHVIDLLQSRGRLQQVGFNGSSREISRREWILPVIAGRPSDPGSWKRSTASSGYENQSDGIQSDLGPCNCCRQLILSRNHKVYFFLPDVRVDLSQRLEASNFLVQL